MGVSVESVDPVFQQQFMEMMKQVGRDQNVVGWYHSHPGFGPWLSGTDIETQRHMESLGERAVAVVVDPIQSVKGKVVIDAFRSIKQEVMMSGLEPRQTTSNIGHLSVPNTVALVRGLNKHYYSIAINYRKNEGEQKMLLNLGKSNWSSSLKLDTYSNQEKKNIDSLKRLAKLTDQYNKWIQDETKKTTEEFNVASSPHIDVNVPGFDVLQYSIANTCGEPGTGLTKEQSAVVGQWYNNYANTKQAQA